MKKRLLIALGAGTLAFGSVFAFAATLGLASDNLGAGDAAIDSCDETVHSDYSVAYDSAVDHAWEVTHVNLTLDGALCDGQTASIVLTDSAGDVIGTAGGPVGSTGAEAFALTEDDTAAEAVADVHVVISGAAS